MNRDYFFAPDKMEVLHIDTREKFSFTLCYENKTRGKSEEKFQAAKFEEKGLKTLGVRISPRAVESIKVENPKTQQELFQGAEN